LTEIERLGKRLASGPAHPLLGWGSVHASLISGGQELSSYPAHCKLSLERRLVPGEDNAVLEAELREIVSNLTSQDPDFKAELKPGYWARPLETPLETLIVHTLARSTRAVLGRDPMIGTQSFWTDAALLSEAGIPSVLFGPGGEGLHSAVEYVHLDQVAVCAEVLAGCARAFCSA
jgi:acetylornithine deacetylase